MRLINTQTFELKDFGVHPPPYAILSHTWGEEEVSFQDMANLDPARQKKGFAKIEQCCRQAVRDGFDWAWVDTCCIDKTSSAELSETINSMFKWYERALRCYAFLSDVVARPGDELFGGLETGVALRRQSFSSEQSVLFASRWWTRGWTLQELIAPRDVEFYNSDWEYLTCKRACKNYISRCFGIAVSVLDHSRRLPTFCVAERMSWASHRNTTRDEDMAYSLLGILDVNMPLLYGEGGRKAFQRLQEHVLTSTEDYTLFLWGSRMAHFTLPHSWVHALLQARARRTPDASAVPSFLRAPVENVLANSPRDFGLQEAWSDWSDVDPTWLGIGEPPQLTSRGLRLSLFIRQVTKEDMDEASELSGVLNNFLVLLSDNKDEESFAQWLRPGPGDLARPLFLGAFPCPNTASKPLLPCILLFDLDSFSSTLGDATLPLALKTGFPTTYARLKYFFYRLPGTELRCRKWKLTTCYIKSRPGPQQPPRQLGVFGESHDRLWTWRTPVPSIPTLNMRRESGDEDGMEIRQSFHLDATETFPGCGIFVAIRPNHYWFSHRVGNMEPFSGHTSPLKDRYGWLARSNYVRTGHSVWYSPNQTGSRMIGSRYEGEQFRVMDLSSMWMETVREEGPLCEAQVDFGTGSLLITLFIQKSDAPPEEWYRVYLALGERRDRPQEQAPVVLQPVGAAAGENTNVTSILVRPIRAAVTTTGIGSVSDMEEQPVKP